VDPAYGGGDRCVGIVVEFGMDKDGRQILKVNTPHLITIDLTDPRIPEEQIADFVWAHLTGQGIPPGNCFYDSFGKGTIGYSFARKFGSNCPVPVDVGGRPSSRPVRHDLFIWDEAKRMKRLMRADEQYSKRISEHWFAWRACIESEQMRELPEEVMMEGTSREYTTVMGNKIELESKDDLKERTGKSPDLADSLCTAIEGARQKGFQIAKLGEDKNGPEEENPLDLLIDRWQSLNKRKQLTYSP